MSSILRKLTGATEFEDEDEDIEEEEDLRESLKNKFNDMDEDDDEEDDDEEPEPRRKGKSDGREESYVEERQATHAQQDEDEAEGVLTIDVYQTENDIVIVSTIAGVTSNDLEVSITNDMVTIKGERRNVADVRDDDYFYQECYWGSFSRSVILPIDVDAENAKAELKDGVLQVFLPKSEKVKSKRIPIK
jgi:HSP20 family protein